MAALGLLMLQTTTLRSLALAATAALAVFGSVAVGSAREDLLVGIARFTEPYARSADIWVVHPADDQATRDFPAKDLDATRCTVASWRRCAPLRAATSTSPAGACGCWRGRPARPSRCRCRRSSRETEDRDHAAARRWLADDLR